MDRMRLEFAAEGFLSTMRRIHAGRMDAPDVEIKTLSDYSPEDRQALMQAIGAALKMTQPETDQRYQTWLINRKARETA